MNERIRELAKQAGGNPNYSAFRGHLLPPPHTYIDPATVDLTKFAELIVKECAKAVEDSIWHLPRGYKAADQAKFVKQHFGVT